MRRTCSRAADLFDNADQSLVSAKFCPAVPEKLAKKYLDQPDQLAAGIKMLAAGGEATRRTLSN